MKALQLPAFGPPAEATELVDVESPAPGRGEVAVAIEAAPINPSDLMLIAPDGAHPGHRGSGTAVEAAAEKTEFSEQGVDWVRLPRPEGGWVYVPKAGHDGWTAELLAQLP